MTATEAAEHARRVMRKGMNRQVRASERGGYCWLTVYSREGRMVDRYGSATFARALEWLTRAEAFETHRGRGQIVLEGSKPKGCAYRRVAR